MPQVFISHSSRDRSFVDGQLIPFLRNEGLKLWYSTVEIKGGELWEDEIRKGLAESDTVLVLVSQASTQSEWVKTEVSMALKGRRRVVPVLLDGSLPEDIHLRLVRLQHVDLRKPDELALRGLLAVLEGSSPPVPDRGGSRPRWIRPVGVVLLLIAAFVAWRIWSSESDDHDDTSGGNRESAAVAEETDPKPEPAHVPQPSVEPESEPDRESPAEPEPATVRAGPPHDAVSPVVKIESPPEGVTTSPSRSIRISGRVIEENLDRLVVYRNTPRGHGGFGAGAYPTELAVSTDGEQSFFVEVEVPENFVAVVEFEAVDKSGNRSERVTREFKFEDPREPWEIAIDKAVTAGRSKDWRAAHKYFEDAFENGVPDVKIPAWLQEGIEKWKAKPVLTLLEPEDGAKIEALSISFRGTIETGRTTDRIFSTLQDVPIVDGRWTHPMSFCHLGPVSLSLTVKDGDEIRGRLKGNITLEFPKDDFQKVLDAAWDGFQGWRVGESKMTTGGDRNWKSLFDLSGGAGECLLVSNGTRPGLTFRADLPFHPSCFDDPKKFDNEWKYLRKCMDEWLRDAKGIRGVSGPRTKPSNYSYHWSFSRIGFLGASGATGWVWLREYPYTYKVRGAQIEIYKG